MLVYIGIATSTLARMLCGQVAARRASCKNACKGSSICGAWMGQHRRGEMEGCPGGGGGGGGGCEGCGGRRGARGLGTMPRVLQPEQKDRVQLVTLQFCQHVFTLLAATQSCVDGGPIYFGGAPSILAPGVPLVVTSFMVRDLQASVHPMYQVRGG